ncbi:MAG: PKD domain-containing protein [Thermoplasmata archaeon]|nr:MAG: PKD domain-containing protein [Thermoplasmata archaeon]
MVDIDIGGTENDEIEDDDVIQVEEVEVVEEVGAAGAQQEPVAAPPMQPPPREKKPSPWMKRILVISVVIILLIVAVFAYVYLRTDITDISVDLTRDEPGHEDELLVTVLVGSSGSASIAGKGDLEILFNDDVVYSSKISIDDGGTGRLFVPYNSFLDGNGNYYVRIKYKDAESPLKEYKEEHIIESLNITAEVGKVDGTGQLNMTVFLPLDPEDAKIRVDEIRNIDNDNPITTNEPSEPISETTYEDEFTFTKSGNYSFTVTIENSRVKSDSDFYEVTETTLIFLNILPIANAVITNIDAPPLSTTFTVSFDASSSWNDGDKTLYVWDFDDNGDIDTETEDPTTSWTYTKGFDYDARLTVFGDVYVDPQAGDLESDSVVIRVESP